MPGEFNEELHPRDKAGKFATKDGVGAGGASKSAPKAAAPAPKLPYHERLRAWVRGRREKEQAAKQARGKYTQLLSDLTRVSVAESKEQASGQLPLRNVHPTLSEQRLLLGDRAEAARKVSEDRERALARKERMHPERTPAEYAAEFGSHHARPIRTERGPGGAINEVLPPREKPKPKPEHRNAVKLKDRTEEEIKEAREQNARDFDEDDHAKMVEMFGDRIPTLDDFARGYGLHDGTEAEVRVRSTYEGFTLNGQHYYEDEYGNQHEMFKHMSRDYNGAPGDPEAHVYHAHLNVAPEFRSTGVGKQVLANSVRLNHELGYRRIETTPAGSYNELSFEDWEQNRKDNDANWKDYQDGKKSFEDMKARANELDIGYIGPHAWSSFGFQHDGSYEEHFNGYMRDHHFDEFAREVLDADRYKELAEKAKLDKYASRKARSAALSEYLEGYQEDDDNDANADDFRRVIDAIDEFTGGMEQGRDIVRLTTPKGTPVGSHFMACFADNPHEGHWVIDMIRDKQGWNIMKKRLDLMDLEP